MTPVLPELGRAESTFLRVATGAATTCVIDDVHRLWCAGVLDGAASCWGLSTAGELGLGMTNPLVPTTLPGAWRTLALGQSHGCGIASDGRLLCWGSNTSGVLGTGDWRSTDAPVVVGTKQTWSTVVASWSHTCALETDGSLWCWGDNEHGQLGTGTAWSNELLWIR